MMTPSFITATVGNISAGYVSGNVVDVTPKGDTRTPLDIWVAGINFHLELEAALLAEQARSVFVSQAWVRSLGLTTDELQILWERHRDGG